MATVEVPLETPEQIAKRLADFEKLFRLRYTEQEDNYKRVCQKEDRWLNVPVISPWPPRPRRREWEDRKRYRGSGRGRERDFPPRGRGRYDHDYDDDYPPPMWQKGRRSPRSDYYEHSRGHQGHDTSSIRGHQNYDTSSSPPPPPSHYHYPPRYSHSPPHHHQPHKHEMTLDFEATPLDSTNLPLTPRSASPVPQDPQQQQQQQEELPGLPGSNPQKPGNKEKNLLLDLFSEEPEEKVVPSTSDVLDILNNASFGVNEVTSENLKQVQKETQSQHASKKAKQLKAKDTTSIKKEPHSKPSSLLHILSEEPLNPVTMATMKPRHQQTTPPSGAAKILHSQFETVSGDLDPPPPPSKKRKGHHGGVISTETTTDAKLSKHHLKKKDHGISSKVSKVGSGSSKKTKKQKQHHGETTSRSKGTKRARKKSITFSSSDEVLVDVETTEHDPSPPPTSLNISIKTETGTSQVSASNTPVYHHHYQPDPGDVVNGELESLVVTVPRALVKSRHSARSPSFSLKLEPSMGVGHGGFQMAGNVETFTSRPSRTSPLSHDMVLPSQPPAHYHGDTSSDEDNSEEGEGDSNDAHLMGYRVTKRDDLSNKITFTLGNDGTASTAARDMTEVMEVTEVKGGDRMKKKKKKKDKKKKKKKKSSKHRSPTETDGEVVQLGGSLCSDSHVMSLGGGDPNVKAPGGDGDYDDDDDDDDETVTDDAQSGVTVQGNTVNPLRVTLRLPPPSSPS